MITRQALNLTKQRKGRLPGPWTLRNLTRGRIQEGLEAERLDVGIAAGLETSGMVEVMELVSYGIKLLLPEGGEPDKSGWKRLADLPVVVLEGDGGFRRFLAEREREDGVTLKVGAEVATGPTAGPVGRRGGADLPSAKQVASHTIGFRI